MSQLHAKGPRSAGKNGHPVGAAPAPFETLEARRLMHGAVQLAVNFQPAGAAVPAGYVADVGQVFGDRGDGLAFGWNADNAAHGRDRNSTRSPGQQYDTLTHMQKSGGGRVWEIALPNGQYFVRAVAGDAGYYDSDFRINAEGVALVRGKASSSNRFIEGNRTVTVADGRLTLTNATGAVNNKICFVEIEAVHDATEDPTKPQVSVIAADPRAGETGPDAGVFRISRSVATDAALTVNYVLAGTAANGQDYQTLSGSAVIPAGATGVDVTVAPLTDAVTEGDESVVLTLAADGTVAFGDFSTATVTIADAGGTSPTPAPVPALTWRQVAAAPLARQEAGGTVVNGKLYVFGGYVDTTYRPTRRVDVYDPAANTWSRGADLPVGLTHAGIANDGRYIYIVGGYPAGEGTRSQIFATDAVRRYDTVENKWTTLAALPGKRGGGALVLLGRTLHYFGGSDINRIDRDEHWSFDLDRPAAGWTGRADIPGARNHLAGTAVGGVIYAIGGQNSQDSNARMSTQVLRYDPAADKWTPVASLPKARSHASHSTAVYNGRIYTFAGEGQGNVNLTDVSMYDPAANKWTNLTPLPSPRKSGVADIIDGKVVFTGGGNSGLKTTTWVGELG